MNLSTAFNGKQLDLRSAIKQSKMSFLTSISQHYENQLPLLSYQINELYERLFQITDLTRYAELERDLAFFLKGVKANCKKTKAIKTRKLERKTIPVEHDSWLPSLFLKQREKNAIQKNEWLTDEILDAASKILKKKHPHITGLVNAAFCVNGFDKNPYEGIQFHNINGNHWVLSSSLGGRIKSYDSDI